MPLTKVNSVLVDGAINTDSSGNVGIGTSSIASGGAGTTNFNVHTPSLNTVYFKLSNAGTGNTASDGFDLLTDSSGVAYVWNRENQSLLFGTNNTERMRIDSSGNVGIGTSSPNARVQIETNGASNPIVTITNSGASTGMYLNPNSSGGAVFGTYTNTSQLFATNNLERMRIDTSGNLLVGTTDAVGRFTVNRTSGSWSASFRGANASGNILIGNQSGTSAYDAIVFTHSGFSTQTGNITINSNGTTSYSSASDYRLKENIAPMIGALSKVQALKPVTYTWKADGSDGQGFIAHELADVIPDAVTGEKDAVDAEGKIKPQTIDTSFLVATLTAAIQELKAELDTVKTELATLKATP